MKWVRLLNVSQGTMACLGPRGPSEDVEELKAPVPVPKGLMIEKVREAPTSRDKQGCVTTSATGFGGGGLGLV